jgi:hypothetical protein
MGRVQRKPGTYYDRNRDRLLPIHREAALERARANREECRNRAREWVLRNPERSAARNRRWNSGRDVYIAAQLRKYDRFCREVDEAIKSLDKLIDGVCKRFQYYYGGVV